MEEEQRAARFGWAAAALAVVTIIVAALVLTGWWLDIPILRSLRPDWPAMKPGAALGLLFSAVPLLLLRAENSSARRSDQAGRLLAALALLLGALVLVDRLFYELPGIRTFLLGPTTGAGSKDLPIQVSLATALGLCLMGLGLLLLDVKAAWGLWPAQLLASFLLIIGMTGVLGYVYSPAGLQHVFFFASQPLHSALCILLMGVAL